LIVFAGEGFLWLGPGKLMAESLPVCAVHREDTFEPSTGGWEEFLVVIRRVGVPRPALGVDIGSPRTKPAEFPLQGRLALIAGFALPPCGAISVTSLST
jgi:hypothetical protein